MFRSLEHNLCTMQLSNICHTYVTHMSHIYVKNVSRRHHIIYVPRSFPNEWWPSLPSRPRWHRHCFSIDFLSCPCFQFHFPNVSPPIHIQCATFLILAIFATFQPGIQTLPVPVCVWEGEKEGGGKRERVESRKQRVESREQRAENREQRTENREQRTHRERGTERGRENNGTTEQHKSKTKVSVVLPLPTNSSMLQSFNPSTF